MTDVSKTNEELLAKVMDTLAYYQCRANNPKADHPIQGYHAFSEEQRDHLREKQREGAEEIVRMFAATRVPVQGEHQHEWYPETSPPRMTCGCDVVKQGEPNDDLELVDVVLTTADIEQLAHLLVQLSPATQKNSGATVRRLMQEMNIKEVEQ